MRFWKCITFIGICAISATALAHVDWSRVNDVDIDMVALYHFDGHDTGIGDTIEVEPGLGPGRGLIVGAATGAGMSAVHDTPEPIFDPHSLSLDSTQSAQSLDTIPHLDGDLTVEFWFKWDNTLTSSSLEVGLRSGAKIRITRDSSSPSNDQFGYQATHGDFVSAPGFVNWPTVGPEEGPLGEWVHVALTVHSTGMHFDSGSGHDVYNAGTTGILFLNGHPAGSPGHVLNLAGTRVHDASKTIVNNIAGQIKIDEVTIWTKDWSANGTNLFPFGNGRGTGLSPLSTRGWEAYE